MKKILLSFKPHFNTMLQIAFGLFFVGLGIYFIRHEQDELTRVRQALDGADPYWITGGVLLLAAFVLVQGLMYQVSFAAIHRHLPLSAGILLYLKRNLISVFLPAGLVTNMLFFNEELEKKHGLNKTQTYFASTIFSICSILSAIIVGLPALLWLFFKSSLTGELMLGVVLTALALGGVIYAIISIIRRGRLYHFLERTFPSTTQLLQQLSDQAFDRKKIWEVVALSVLIECIGIAHLYISVKALGGTPTLEMAVIGYALVLLLLMSSPFLRGLGAIEAALTYALTLFGLSAVLALSVALLFRFFEFWALLVLGLLALVSRRDNLLVRVLPAVLLFLLGVVNLISALTPALPARLAVLREVIPLSAIHASTWLVLFAGLIMLVLAAFLL
ncbi:MAG: flippase-like domain-containing protein, partial [Sinomicrobium sp.]|nr:flippase-like domain-containing protein [Sinomicrobium sp.]